MPRSRLATWLTISALGLACGAIIPHHLLRADQEKCAAARADSTDALVEKKLQTCLRVVTLIEKSRRMGAPVRASAQELTLWSRQVLEARIYLSLTRDERKTQDIEVYLSLAKGPANPARVAAFEQYARAMKAQEDLFRPQFEAGNLSAYDFAMLEAIRLQAEIWLSREKDRG
jgi:hypothetical protein